jgi:hypothetical protein
MRLRHSRFWTNRACRRQARAAPRSFVGFHYRGLRQWVHARLDNGGALFTSSRLHSTYGTNSCWPSKHVRGTRSTDVCMMLGMELPRG